MDKVGTAKTSTHYNKFPVQPIELMQMMLTPEEFRGFLKGNIMKYSFRVGHKASESVDKDIAKCEQYKKWLDITESGGTIDPRE